MLYLQFRVLAFTALMRLSTAGTFSCNNGGTAEVGGAVIECEITLNPGNTFRTFEYQSWGCTHDGRYCAEITSVTDDEWAWQVHNNGAICTGSCSPHVVPSMSEVYYACQVESC